MSMTYALHPTYYVLRDEHRDSVQFHLDVGDYFGTLATVLGLVRQSLADGTRGIPFSVSQIVRMLADIETDLVLLQRTHAIVPRSQRRDT